MLDELLSRRWSDGVARCPRCGNDHVYASKARPFHWQCKKCGANNRRPYRFSLKTGTIFEETKLPLKLPWFKTLLLMLTSKKGISALQIHRLLGTGSYRSAWYMCMRLRGGMKDPEFKQLMGIVEEDETYIGGKEGNKHLGKRSGRKGVSGKTEVIGAISRKGSVVCKMIGKRIGILMITLSVKRCSNKVSLVATDDSYHYRDLQDGLSAPFGDHTAQEYVRGEVHTRALIPSGRCSNEESLGPITMSARNICRSTLRSFNSASTTGKKPDIFGKAIAGC